MRLSDIMSNRNNIIDPEKEIIWKKLLDSFPALWELNRDREEEEELKKFKLQLLADVYKSLLSFKIFDEMSDLDKTNNLESLIFNISSTILTHTLPLDTNLDAIPYFNKEYVPDKKPEE